MRSWVNFPTAAARVELAAASRTALSLRSVGVTAVFLAQDAPEFARGGSPGWAARGKTRLTASRAASATPPESAVSHGQRCTMTEWYEFHFCLQVACGGAGGYTCGPAARRSSCGVSRFPLVSPFASYSFLGYFRAPLPGRPGASDLERQISPTFS